MPDAIMPTYGRQDISFVKGDGAWLTDTNGNRYLDALAGIAVVGIGHANPEVAKTISEQSTTLLHTSNLYRVPKQEELAEKLQRVSGMDNMFFGNSGAEANECAIKIARLYGNKKNIENAHHYRRRFCFSWSYSRHANRNREQKGPCRV